MELFPCHYAKCLIQYIFVYIIYIHTNLGNTLNTKPTYLKVFIKFVLCLKLNAQQAALNHILIFIILEIPHHKALAALHHKIILLCCNMVVMSSLKDMG